MSNSLDINLTKLADDIEIELPALQLQRPLTELGSDFRSIVVRDASATIYRIGKTRSVAKGYRYEASLLSQVRSSPSMSLTLGSSQAHRSDLPEE